VNSIEKFGCTFEGDIKDSTFPHPESEIPIQRPEPVPNKKVQITMRVYGDHAHCEVTRRLVTGILALIISTPVCWFSNMQKTVDTSSYGSELMAARIATEIAMEFCYNICIKGFALDGPVNMFGDNRLVAINTTIPSSQLKKKMNEPILCGGGVPTLFME
jgi:hypothetical protein